MPGAHLARAARTRGCPFISAPALIGTTPWPHITHGQLQTILRAGSWRKPCDFGGVTGGFLIFFFLELLYVEFMSWQRQETIVNNVATRARRQPGQGL